jgi:hypothetical protein
MVSQKTFELLWLLQQKLEDTKGVILNFKSKVHIQNNGEVEIEQCIN